MITNIDFEYEDFEYDLLVDYDIDEGNDGTVGEWGATFRTDEPYRVATINDIHIRNKKGEYVLLNRNVFNKLEYNEELLEILEAR